MRKHSVSGLSSGADCNAVVTIIFQSSRVAG